MSHHENWPPHTAPTDDEQPTGGAVAWLAIAILVAVIGYLLGLLLGWWPL